MMGRQANYTGESGRPLHSRLAEHYTALLQKSKQSVLHNHNLEMHPREEMVPEDWLATRTGSYSTPLERQAAEGVLLAEEVKLARVDKSKVVLNSKLDWVQAGVVMG